MTKEELKKLFEKYDIFTLDSLSILLSYLDESELKEIGPVFRNVYKKKYKHIEEEFEGINEYDDKNILLNFDIQNIIDNIILLNKKELDFISHLVSTSSSKIDKTNDENYQMIYYLKNYQHEIAIFTEYTKYSVNTIDDSFTKKELEKFFEKYDVIELAYMEQIIENARYEYNVYRLYKVYNKVLNSKSPYDIYTIDEYHEKQKTSRISDIKKKNHLLNKKELTLLKNLIDSFSNILDDEYYIKEFSILENSLIEEIDKRKRQKTITKKPKK